MCYAILSNNGEGKSTETEVWIGSYNVSKSLAFNDYLKGINFINIFPIIIPGITHNIGNQTGPNSIPKIVKSTEKSKPAVTK